MSKSVPCSFYLNGNCSKGENCKFSHSNVEALPKKQKEVLSKKNSPCIFWFGMKGKQLESCTKGENCNYSHNPDSCNGYPCESFFNGTCELGDKCHFSHTDNGDESKFTAAGIVVYKKIGNAYKFFLINETIKETGEIIYAEPGGKKEPRENSIDAAKREFGEETGMQPPPITADKAIKIPEFKYIIYTYRVPESFNIETSKGKFVEIDADTRLHPRSEKVLRNFDL